MSVIVTKSGDWYEVDIQNARKIADALGGDAEHIKRRGIPYHEIYSLRDKLAAAGYELKEASR